MKWISSLCDARIYFLNKTIVLCPMCRGSFRSSPQQLLIFKHGGVLPSYLHTTLCIRHFFTCSFNRNYQKHCSEANAIHLLKNIISKQLKLNFWVFEGLLFKSRYFAKDILGLWCQGYYQLEVVNMGFTALYF